MFRTSHTRPLKLFPSTGQLLLVLFLSGRVTLAGTTYYVSASGDDSSPGLSAETPFATLPKAIETANGDPSAEAVVILDDLVLTAPVELTGPYSLRGPSADPAAATLRAEGTVSPLVKVSDSSAAVAHLTLSGGTATETSGGNLWLNGGGTATNCILRNAVGDKAHGGGVWNDNGLVTHCVIEGGYFTGACHGVGVYQTGEKAVTAHSMIRNNRTVNRYGTGGGIETEGGRISDCVISNNVAGFTLGDDGQGGGIHARSSEIFRCLVANNRGGSLGGGIYIDDQYNVVSNCTIVCNETRDGSSAIYGGGAGSKFYNLVIWGNRTILGTKGRNAECYFHATYGKVFNSLSETGYGVDPVEGMPCFRNPEEGDYRLSAMSPAIGRATDGGDLGYEPFDSTSLSVGLAPLPAKALPPASYLFEACARGGEAPVSLRWRMDDLLMGTMGEYTPYGPSTNFTADLSAGRYRICVEAKDAAGTTATFSRSFRVGAKTVHLVTAGTEGNMPSIPYDTKATAANDIHEALLYCADGTELVVADGDYGVTNEVIVSAAVLIRSENGPGKTSIYRIGKRGQGLQSRVVLLRGKGATLSGFAVTNGYFNTLATQKYGTNIAAYEDDTVTNCILSDAVGTAERRGTCAVAIVDGRLYGCVIRNNDGGGFFGGAVSLFGEKAHMADCVVTNHLNRYNYYAQGLGVHAEGGALIERCIIRDNANREGKTGGTGGGVFLLDSEIRDSLVCRNKAGQNGGGGIYARGSCRFVNCTIADNASAGDGGGLKVENKDNHAATVVNTLFHGNVSSKPSVSPGEPSWMNLDGPKSSASHIAVPDAEAAIGTSPVLLAADPFAASVEGDYSLSQGSPCRDSGDNGERAADELDVIRHPRIVKGTIDIGAYEFQIAETLNCSFTLSGYDTVGAEVVASATVDGEHLSGLEYRWGIAPAEGEPVFTWTDWNASDCASFQLAPGRYRFCLDVRNDAGQSSRAMGEESCHVVSKEVYLVPSEKSVGEPLYPYDCWEHAATNIAMALGAAGNGSTVWVTNGNYGVMSSVIIDKAIAFRSLEGPGATSIFRAAPRTEPEPSFRLVTMTGVDALFCGFTVSNAIVREEAFNGAALLCQNATVSNCVFSGNEACTWSLGGTVMNIDGLVTHSRICGNEGGAGDGFGLCQVGKEARTTDCSIYGNRTSGFYCHGAAVVYGGVLDSCVITGNVVRTNSDGGVACGIKLLDGLVYNCLVALNQGGAGGGGITATQGAIVNCTVVSNVCTGISKTRAGGIAFVSLSSNQPVGVTNCIVYGNFNSNSDGSIGNGMESARTDKAPVSLSHTLLENWREIDPDAVGCQTGDPRFKDFEGRDWHLAGDSPCRDAGSTLDLMLGGLDLDGRPRVIHRDLVDLGCYEADFIGRHTLLLLR